jgi:hypothetical protein
MATDPFGTNMFGGATSIPGGTSAATAATPAASTAYKYLGQGWNDPLAQQMYQKYAFGGKLSPGAISRLSGPATQAYVGSGNYHNPMDPKEWGGSVRGAEVDAMKAAYLAAGGQGTYDQLAATNPKAVGWPTDAAGNPLGRMNPTTGATEMPNAATGAWAPGSGGSGSTNTLAPEILQKMWR